MAAVGLGLAAAAFYFFTRDKSAVPSTTTAYEPGMGPTNATTTDGTKYETVDAGNFGIYPTVQPGGQFVNTTGGYANASVSGFRSTASKFFI
jgi:hypothetical protein